MEKDEEEEEEENEQGEKDDMEEEEYKYGTKIERSSPKSIPWTAFLYAEQVSI